MTEYTLTVWTCDCDDGFSHKPIVPHCMICGVKRPEILTILTTALAKAEAYSGSRASTSRTS